MTLAFVTKSVDQEHLMRGPRRTVAVLRALNVRIHHLKFFVSDSGGVVGWLLAIEDPDGQRLRLYARETHGPEVTPDWDDPWIKS